MALKKKTLPRPTLVIPAVSKANSTQVYFLFEEDKKKGNDAVAHACLNQAFSRMDGPTNISLFVHKHHGLTEKDIKHWIIFMCRCGFKCYYEQYSGKIQSIIGEIIFKAEDYTNFLHQKIAMTAVRYICYHFQNGYNEIPALATKIYNECEELDAYQAFILAHYAQSAGSYFDGSHGVVSFSNYRGGIAIPITKEKLMEKIKKASSNSVNENCCDYKKESFGDLFTLAKQGKWKSVIEKLEK